MAPRRAQPTKANTTTEDQVSGDESEELDFLASQQSNGSDDHECGACNSFIHSIHAYHCVWENTRFAG
jgi:hypothetical protein